jgi:hypothetical protein
VQISLAAPLGDPACHLDRIKVWVLWWKAKNSVSVAGQNVVRKVFQSAWACGFELICEAVVLTWCRNLVPCCQ